MQAYEMETRTCICGCGGEFRVMKGSSQVHRSIFCEKGESKPVERPRPKLEAPTFTYVREQVGERIGESTTTQVGEISLETVTETKEIPAEPEVKEESEMGLKIMSASAIAKELGIAKSNIYYMAKKGKIVAYEGGFLLEEVQRARSNRESATAPEKAKSVKVAKKKKVEEPVVEEGLEDAKRSTAKQLVSLAAAARAGGDRRSERKALWMAVDLLQLVEA